MTSKGAYQHFKGDVYRVVCTAEHSETGEMFVIHRDGANKFWARPEAMFNDSVKLPDGSVVPRFDYLGYSI